MSLPRYLLQVFSFAMAGRNEQIMVYCDKLCHSTPFIFSDFLLVFFRITNSLGAAVVLFKCGTSSLTMAKPSTFCCVFLLLNYSYSRYFSIHYTKRPQPILPQPVCAVQQVGGFERSSASYTMARAIFLYY